MRVHRGRASSRGWRLAMVVAAALLALPGAWAAPAKRVDAVQSLDACMHFLRPRDRAVVRETRQVAPMGAIVSGTTIEQEDDATHYFRLTSTVSVRGRTVSNTVIVGNAMGVWRLHPDLKEAIKIGGPRAALPYTSLEGNGLHHDYEVESQVGTSEDHGRPLIVVTKLFTEAYRKSHAAAMPPNGPPGPFGAERKLRDAREVYYIYADDHSLERIVRLADDGGVLSDQPFASCRQAPRYPESFFDIPEGYKIAMPGSDEQRDALESRAIARSAALASTAPAK